MKPRKHLLAIAILWLTCCSAAFAHHPKPKPAIQVDLVTTAAGIDIPADYIDALNRDIALELGKTHHFERVLTSDDPADSPAPAVHMKGTVTKFKAGSRRTRGALMAAGLAGSVIRTMGVGETMLLTHIALTEPISGNLIWEGDVKGAEKGGAFTASVKVTNIEAKSIAKAVIKAMDNQTKQPS